MTAKNSYYEPNVMAVKLWKLIYKLVSTLGEVRIFCSLLALISCLKLSRINGIV